MAQTISNTDDVIDSRDVIARIEELEDERQTLVAALEEATEAKNEQNDTEDTPDINLHDAVLDAQEALDDWDASEEAEELTQLKSLAEDAESSPDWQYGEALIAEDYFTKYIKELVDDCYELPKNFDTNTWPWRHMTMDWEAAADEAKQDYFEVMFGGNTYLIRA
jgi:hypothetical protein